MIFSPGFLGLVAVCGLCSAIFGRAQCLFPLSRHVLPPAAVSARHRFEWFLWLDTAAWRRQKRSGSLATLPRFTDYVADVLVVFDTEVFHDFGVLKQG